MHSFLPIQYRQKRNKDFCFGMDQNVPCCEIFTGHKKNLENIHLTKRPLFAISFRNMLLKIPTTFLIPKPY